MDLKSKIKWRPQFIKYKNPDLKSKINSCGHFKILNTKIFAAAGPNPRYTSSQYGFIVMFVAVITHVR